MLYVRCPHCSMQVIIQKDGTCPLCHKRNIDSKIPSTAIRLKDDTGGSLMKRVAGTVSSPENIVKGAGIAVVAFFCVLGRGFLRHGDNVLPIVSKGLSGGGDVIARRGDELIRGLNKTPRVYPKGFVRSRPPDINPNWFDQPGIGHIPLSDPHAFRSFPKPLDESPARPVHPSDNLGTQSRQVLPRITNHFPDIASDFIRISEGNHADNVAREVWSPIDGEMVFGHPLRSHHWHWNDSPTHVNPHVIAVIPKTDDAFQNVFRRISNNASQQQISQIERRFSSLKHTQTLTTESSGREQLFKLIDESDANPVIIIGHSEESESATHCLRLPNGESVPIHEIHEAGLACNKRCLVLTCYGEDFRIAGKLRLDDAYKMCEKAMGMGEIQSVDELINGMRFDRNLRRATRIGMSSIVVASGTGSACIAYSYLTDNGEEDADESPTVKTDGQQNVTSQ